jgi:uncharacterized protein (DUF1697 family)
MRFVAFLRGINVGGQGLVRMDDLKKAFAAMGLKGVRTVLASGNVVFESERSDGRRLAAAIAAGLRQAFARAFGVIVRGWDELEALRSADPFKGIVMTPGARLYVTFLPDRAKRPALALPHVAANGGLRILRATATEVFSVVDRGRGAGTPELMALLEREFGAGLTTRNWDTVLKVLR